MIEIGRVAVKTAGRDAGKKCVIIDILDNKFVLIDGQTRRRRCNILHIEPLGEVISIEKNASHDVVKEVFKDLGIELKDTTPKQASKRPVQVRGKSIKTEKPAKKTLFSRKKKENIIDAEVSETKKAAPKKETQVEKILSKKETALEELAGLEDKEAKEEKPNKTAEKSEKKPAVKKKKAALK